MLHTRFFTALLMLGLVLSACQPAESPTPFAAAESSVAEDADAAPVLPSWNAGATRETLIEFVTAVSDESSSQFVPVAERIAVFDNDGTLWSEQPMYFQLAFAMGRIHDMADSHPEWQDEEPFRSVLANDMRGVMAGGEEGLIRIIDVTHSGMTVAEFTKAVTDWAATAVHPGRMLPYTSMVYQPMLELLDYLRANDFTTYIVSGGGIGFMRPWVEEVYGIPPNQVIGSFGKLRYEMQDGEATLMREPGIEFINDKAGKPVGIQRHIGRRPLMAFGNSDGDKEMLQWTTGGEGPRMGALVRHTDAEREWAYDRESHVGRLDTALDEAPERNWVVIDMQRDWAQIFPD